MVDSLIMKKTTIAFFMQHYLTPSMTFIFRQLNLIKKKCDTIVLVSNKLENVDLFPTENIEFKKRNFIKLKTSRLFNHFYSLNRLLSISPKLSNRQKSYFERIIKNNNVDIIHAHFGPSGIEILPVAKRLKFPLIVSFHGYDASFLLEYEKYTQKLKDLFNYATVIVPTEYMLKKLSYLGLNSHNSRVIHYGIMLSDFEYKKIGFVREKFLRNDKIFFLQVSNFVEKKGHFFTLKAFKKLLEKYPNAHLTLAGDGILKNQIKKFCNELNLDNYVDFPGLVNQNEVKKLMKDADIFVHHSVTAGNGDQEGVPNVLIEAMASGLPVISTYHAGIPELINDGVNGFLVKEKDIDRYYQRMFDILSKGDDFKLNARRKIEELYNLEIEMNKLIELYTSLTMKSSEI